MANRLASLSFDTSSIVSGAPFPNQFINWASPGDIGAVTPKTGGFSAVNFWSGSFRINLAAPSLSSNVNLALPSTQPSDGQLIRTSGTSGATQFVTQTSPGVSQTVQRGSIDASGFPNMLSAGSGLQVVLSASAANPCVLSFGAGYDASNGVAQQFSAIISSNQSLSVPASSTSYIFVDRAGSTLSLGSSTLVPVYRYETPASPAVGQHWYSMNDRRMYEWSGSSWVGRFRVFVGECVTNVSAVTSVITYAYNGIYKSSYTAVTGGSEVSFNHNLGMNLDEGLTHLSMTAGSVSLPYPMIAYTTFWNGSVNVNYGWYLSSSPNTRLSQVIYIGSNVYREGVTWQPSGNVRLFAQRGWV